MVDLEILNENLKGWLLHNQSWKKNPIYFEISI